MPFAQTAARVLAGLGLLLAAQAQAQTLAPSDAQAARFLTQASFGPTKSEIDRVKLIGYAGWLADQFGRQASLHRPDLEGQSGGLLGLPPLQEQLDAEGNNRQEVWWRLAITAPDQLRQRMAYALSQILVVSDQVNTLNVRPLLVAEYTDILVRNAFGNYRTLLEEVSRAPAMGLYLSSIRNAKAHPATGRRPDENYAREIMQLFSIGLWQLNLDGSAKLDGAGQRIPTYTQAEVENLARVFTGWTWADAADWNSPGESYAPMRAFEDQHDREAKTLVGGAALPAGQGALQDLRAALDVLFNHPNVAPFVARRLIQHFTTSNPSPAYIRRVAQAFNDNGLGQRGDLQAVLRAVLLDAEARAAPAGTFGKLREPILRLTAIWRAFNAAAANRRYDYLAAARELGQAPLRAESVFNFFQPDYRAPGEPLQLGLYAPEFQIQNGAQGIAIANALARVTRDHYEGAPGTDQTTITIKLEREAQLAADPPALVEHLNTLMLAGRMSDGMRRIVTDYIASVPLEDGRRRASLAIFLIASSPEFAVQP